MESKKPRWRQASWVHFLNRIDHLLRWTARLSIRDLAENRFILPRFSSEASVLYRLQMKNDCAVPRHPRGRGRVKALGRCVIWPHQTCSASNSEDHGGGS